MRASLLRLADDEHCLVLTIHHIIGDAWSISVMFNDLVQLYNAFTAGRCPVLPELPIQYADYAVWQRERLRGEVLERHLNYWRRQLDKMPPVLELPADRPRPAIQNHRGTRQQLMLPRSLTEQLRAFCRQQDVTMFMTLLAAFKVLIYRYTQQEDIIVGTPVAGRDRSEVEGLIGFFINTLVLRTDLSRNPTFIDLLRRVRETALEAYSHRELPFEELVKELQPTRDLSYAPLFQVVFMLDSATAPAPRLGDLQTTGQDIGEETSKFDLTLSLSETENGCLGSIIYRTDLFEPETMARMAEHYQNLLNGIVAHSSARISELPILGLKERYQLLVEWNTTAADYPEQSCIHELFEEQVSRSPETPAVISDTEQLTYVELNSRANQVAHFLRRFGIGAESRVAVLMERSVDMVVGLLGVLKAGGGYVPLDPQYPPDRLSFMIEDARPQVVLTQERLAGCVKEQAGVRVVSLDRRWSDIARERADEIGSVSGPGNLAYVIYTSGSTGRPKGILLHHRGLCNLIVDSNKLFFVDADSCVLQFASPSFDVSVWEIFMALVAGSTLALGSRDTFFSRERLREIVHRHRVTVALLPPSLLRVLDAGEFPTLKTVIAVGERVTTEIVRKWAPGHYFFNGYGPAEGTVTVSAYLTDAGETHYHGPPIGKPLANTRLYVLDRHLQPVPIGVVGELHIGGVCVARGYLNRPELTAERFIPDPFGGDFGTRVYKTGDLARRLPDGNLQFVGRVDHQEKIRGYRIEMGEVETALSNHPAVRECMVVVREDTPGDKRLVAYFISRNGEAPEAGELRQFLKESLPDFMLPSAFVPLEAWPLTPNGKADRAALPKPAALRASGAEYLAPQTEMQRLVAATLQEILVVEQVGIQDNFFDLGLHSLSAVLLQSKLEELLQKKVPMVEIFKYSTVQSLANYLGQQEDEELQVSEFQERARKEKEARQRRLQTRGATTND
jgi:amino acid adenylation domain-containing protein